MVMNGDRSALDALAQTAVGQALLLGYTVTQRAPGNADPTGTTSGWPDGLTLFWDASPNVKLGLYSATLGWTVVTLAPPA